MDSQPGVRTQPSAASRPLAFLDVPFAFTEERLRSAREGDDRAYLHGAADIHESSLALQRTVRDVYLEAAAGDATLRIVDCGDGEGRMASPETIARRIRALVEPLL